MRSLSVMKKEHLTKKRGGGVDEESYYEDEVRNNDEVTDAVGIGGGPKEDIGAEEELERSGIGSNEIFKYTEETSKCCFLLYLIVFSN